VSCDPKQTYDIAVFGSKWTGLTIAFCAAEAGLKTILVERRPVLGWESAWGYELDWTGATSLIGREITERLNAVGGFARNRADAPILELLLDRMADLAYESVEERLAHILLSLGQRRGVHEGNNVRIDLPLS
jgi:glycine/D-amino acid oxidase-like deaminating enzyme